VRSDLEAAQRPGARKSEASSDRFDDVTRDRQAEAVPGHGLVGAPAPDSERLEILGRA
jgi:hypothetical protein